MRGTDGVGDGTSEVCHVIVLLSLQGGEEEEEEQVVLR